MWNALIAREVTADSGGSVLVSCGWRFVSCVTVYRHVGEAVTTINVRITEQINTIKTLVRGVKERNYFWCFFTLNHTSIFSFPKFPPLKSWRDLPPLLRTSWSSGHSEDNDGVKWSGPFNGSKWAGSGLRLGSWWRGSARPGDRRGGCSNPKVTASASWYLTL